MKTFQEAYDIAQKWESEDFIFPGALVARALLKHINNMVSPQVTDEQIVLTDDQIMDIAAPFHDVNGVQFDEVTFARALLSAPPAAETRCPYCDDTGDVHDQTGEWRGTCTCKAAPQEAKPVAADVHKKAFDVELTERQEASMANWAGANQWTPWNRSVLRLAHLLNTTQRGLIDYGAAITFADELVSRIAAAPQEQAPADNSDLIEKLRRKYGHPYWVNVKVEETPTGYSYDKHPLVYEAIRTLQSQPQQVTGEQS